MKKLFGLIFIFLINCSHQKPLKKYYYEGEALGTTYHIKAITSQDSIKLSQKDIHKVIDEVNQSLSTYISTSLISKINKGESLKVDEQFKDVFNAASKIYKETNGLYDPTIGILVNSWGFGPGKKIENIETDSTIVDSLLKFVGYNMVKINAEGRLEKKYPQIFLDYNSIAKGYAIDRVGKMLEKKGFQNYLVEIGGEVLAKGKNIKENRKWTVAIDNPTQNSENKYYSIVALENRAMATSGNYRKFYIDKKTGKKYVHTLNPKTGYPQISHLLSASVLAKNCTLADGYATAFMVLGLEKSKSFLKKHPELDAVLIYSDHNGNLKVFKTPSIKFIK